MLPHNRFNISICNEIVYTTPDFASHFGILPTCPPTLDALPAPDGQVDCEPECDVAVCGYLNSCNAGYLENESSPCKLWLTDNRLTGTIPQAWKPDEAFSNATFRHLEVNCLAGVASQPFCAPVWLPTCLVAALGVAAIACAAKLLQSSTLFRARRELPGAPWLAAWGASAAWGLFILTPAFDMRLQALWQTSSADNMVLARSLSVFTVPMLLVLVGLMIRAISYFSLFLPATHSSDRSRVACSWTLVASVDVLRENLDTIRADQMLLVAVFALLAPCISWLNFMALPPSAIVQIELDTPTASYNGVKERPVWMDIIMAVPRSTVALGVASLLVVAYHVVACLLLPEELWLAQAMRTATDAGVRRRATREHPRAAHLLQSLKWMRAGYWVLLATASISAGSIGPAVWLVLRDSGVDPEAYDYKTHYRAYKEAGDKPLVKDTDPSGVFIVSAGLAAQLLLAAAWNCCCWGLPVKRGKQVLNATPDSDEHTQASATPASRAPWRHVSREQAQRSLMIVGIAMQLIPVLNSGHTLGWILVALVWSINLAAFVAVMVLVRDHPSSFEDLEGKPMFGLVLLASDLEAALARYLEAEEAVDEEEGDAHQTMQPMACCRDHLGGCSACQSLLRRFPATLGRMRRTLALSYRWQPVSRAIAHHKSLAGGLAPGAGVKDGMAGL